MARKARARLGPQVSASVMRTDYGVIVLHTAAACTFLGLLILLVSSEWVIWRQWSRHRTDWVFDGRPAMRKLLLIPRANYGANTRVLLACFRHTPEWARHDQYARAGVLFMRLGAFLFAAGGVLLAVLWLTTPSGAG